MTNSQQHHTHTETNDAAKTRNATIHRTSILPKKQRRIFSNRNVVIAMILLFGLWLLLFDRDNFVRLQEVDKQILELEQERDFYLDLIKADSAVIQGLNDSAFVEQYARENFYLKRPGEVIYIIR